MSLLLLQRERVIYHRVCFVAPPCFYSYFSTFVMSLLVCLVSRNAAKHFMGHRLEETIWCLWAWLIAVLFFYYLWLEAGGYFSLKTLNEQISVVFLSFPSKTNTAKSLQQEAVLLLPTCAATTNTKWKFIKGALRKYGSNRTNLPRLHRSPWWARHFSVQS